MATGTYRAGAKFSAASPCTEDCEYCNATSCACEPTCVNPTAEFDVDGFLEGEDVVVSLGTELSFDGSDSCDDDGTTLLYSWTFGDGHTDGPWESVSHTYEEGGEWIAQLDVLDSDNTECSDDCPNHMSMAPATRSIWVLEVASVSYLGEAKVWKGTEVTWQVETEPPGYYDMVSISGIGEYDSVTGLVTYDCPASSASNTTKFMDITATCGNSVSASDGPVVYHLVSAEVDPETICLDGNSQLETVVDPSGGGLIPTFSGDQISASGIIDGSSPTTLSVDPHTYSATGDTTKTAVLTVLTGTAGSWTLIEEALPFTYSDPSCDYDTTFIKDVYTQGPNPWVIGQDKNHQMGYLEFTGDHNIDDTIQQNSCGVGSAKSENFSYTYGVSVSLEWYGLPVKSFAGVSVTTTWSETINLPADPEKRLKKTLYIPKYEVEDQRGDWKTMYRSVGDDWPSTWNDDSDGDQDVSKSDIILVGGKFKTWGACCD